MRWKASIPNRGGRGGDRARDSQSLALWCASTSSRGDLRGIEPRSVARLGETSCKRASLESGCEATSGQVGRASRLPGLAAVTCFRRLFPVAGYARHTESRRSFAPRRVTKMPICRYFAGATGLEPATSGVTGRVGHDDVQRRASWNGLICRHFSLSWGPRFAWLSQSSDRRLGHEWATKCCRA